MNARTARSTLSLGVLRLGGQRAARHACMAASSVTAGISFGNPGGAGHQRRA